MRNSARIRVHRSFLFHSSQITDIQVMPSSTLELTQFATSSADKTIRVWNLPSVDIRKLENVIIRNVYNRDLS